MGSHAVKSIHRNKSIPHRTNSELKIQNIWLLGYFKGIHSTITLQVLFYLSFKQNYQKKTNFFYVPHSSVWDFKSLIALSSLQVKRGALTPCPPHVYALACCTLDPWLVICLVCEHLLHRGHEFCREKFKLVSPSHVLLQFSSIWYIAQWNKIHSWVV